MKSSFPVQPMKIKPVRPKQTRPTEYLPAILSKAADDLPAPVEKNPKRLRLRSTMSLSALQTKPGSKEYPTLFRPQIGAVGGRTEFHSRSSNAALFIAALATLLVANSGPMDHLVRALQADNPTAYAAVPPQTKPKHSSLFIPLFGPKAVETCALSCATLPTEEKDGCERKCEGLSLSTYPSLHHSARQDATLIAESCADVSTTAKPSPSQPEWLQQTRASYESLRKMAAAPIAGDFANNRLALKRLSKMLETFALPPIGSDAKQLEFGKSVARSVCLRAHIALTELGTILAEQSRDRQGDHYYSALKRSLKETIPEVENSLAKQASTILGKGRKHP